MLLYKAKLYLKEFGLGAHFASTGFNGIKDSEDGPKVNLKNDLKEYKPVKKRLMTQGKQSLPTKSIDKNSFMNYDIDMKDK